MGWPELLMGAIMTFGLGWAVVNNAVPLPKNSTVGCMKMKSTPTDSFAGARPYRLYVNEYNCPDGWKILVE